MKSIFFISTVLVLLVMITGTSLSSTNLLSIGKVYAQPTDQNNEEIFISTPTACVFDDGLSPTDPTDDNCFIIQTGADTGGFDNILFTLTTDESVNTFRCELRDENNVLIKAPIGGITENPSDCRVDQNNAEETYFNLPDGTYKFQVVATKTITTVNNNPTNPTNPIALQTEVTSRSPTFTFFVGTGAGLSAGAGFSLRNDDTAVPLTSLDPISRANRLNPVFQTCQATDPNDLTNRANNAVQNGLSAMKYSAWGSLSLDSFDRELRKFNTNSFVLEIYVNFLSGQIAADLYPTARDIDKVKTKAALFELDPLLFLEEQVPRNTHDSPNRFPFGIQGLDTECVYKAPPVAVSLTSGGTNVFSNPDIFRHGNPPFQTCGNLVKTTTTGGGTTVSTDLNNPVQADSATYAIKFNIDRNDRNKLNDGWHDVKIVITQQISQNNPQFHGTLIFDPYEDSEQRVDLLLNGQDIVTECKNSIIFASDP